MREYLIEIPHSPSECLVAAVEAREGQERRLRAYRGCRSGTHTAWIFADLTAESEAWDLVPSLLRDTARVVQVDQCQLPERRTL